MSIEWTTPKQVESRFRFFMPKDMRNWFVMAKWLRGHKDRVIEIIAAPIFTGDDLNPGEQLLTELPGVYRIARITEGSFGREGNDLRRQVRALMAVTEQRPAGAAASKRRLGLVVPCSGACIMIDRILYAAVALALTSVLVFDGNFAANLSSALGGPLVATPLDTWEMWLCVIFVVLAAVALVREIRRPR